MVIRTNNRELSWKIGACEKRWEKFKDTKYANYCSNASMRFLKLTNNEGEWEKIRSSENYQPPKQSPTDSKNNKDYKHSASCQHRQNNNLGNSSKYILWGLVGFGIFAGVDLIAWYLLKRDKEKT